MNHANMVLNVVSGIQESLQQDQYQRETTTIMQTPVDHVANAVQNTQQQLATQLQQMQLTMQNMQIHYNTVPHGTRQDYGGRQYSGGRGYHSN